MAKDRETRTTVLVALGANLLIAAAKAAGGLITGSPALLSEGAHSVVDSLNEVFLLASLSRSRRKPDARHPFGYGKERYFWSLIAAVGIFVTGGCFSFYQGMVAFREHEPETTTSYVIAIAVLGVALVAEGTSLVRALSQQYAGRRGRTAAASAVSCGRTTTRRCVRSSPRTARRCSASSWRWPAWRCTG